MLETKRELEEAIEEARAAGVTPPDGVKRLLPDAILAYPQLFQQRRPQEHVTRQHVDELSKTPKSGKPLTPVIVFRAGNRWALLDGHHRMLAYQKAGWRKEIPVQVFEGSIDEAIARANIENHRAHLPMTNGEKMSAAWRMVCTTALSGEKICHATGASMRSIASMRNARKKLLAKGKTLGELSGMSWHVARTTAQGETTDETDWDEQDEKEARELAGKLTKLFGKRLHHKHQVIAMALEAYDRQLPGTLRELWDTERGRIEPDEENPDF